MLKRTNIYLEDTILDQLEAEAHSYGRRTLSAVIREACEHWLGRHAVLSALRAAKIGDSRWLYFLPIGSGQYRVELSDGRNLMGPNRELVYSYPRNGGGIGKQPCARCGEEFDAIVGTYTWIDRWFLCTPCVNYMQAESRKLERARNNEEDLRAIAEVEDEPTVAWKDVKAELKKRRG